MSGATSSVRLLRLCKKFILDGWDLEERPPVSEGKGSIIFQWTETKKLSMSTCIGLQPDSLKMKRWRQAPVFMNDGEGSGNVYFHRPPVLVDLFY